MRHTATHTEPPVLSTAEVDAMVDRLGSLCTHHPVRLMYLHGAHARGTQSRLSDLDLAVVVDTRVARSFKAWADLLREVEDATSREDIDLVVLNTAGPIIADRVVRGGRLVYAADDAARLWWEADAIKRALDFQPFSRHYDAALFAQLARQHRSMGIDREILATRLSRVRDTLRRLRRLAAGSRDAYRASETDQLVAERCLHIAIEAALDAGNHVIAAEGYRKPLQLREIPLILAENGDLDRELAGRIADAAGLRNRLVHGYTEIDHDVIYAILQTGLDDLERFAAVLAAHYIEK